MIAILSLLCVLTLSLVVTRVATVALTHTGLSRESARFQARSAFTGVGFTTNESEKVVNHPVRRRILLTLMLVGNAGIVTAVSSLILAFVSTEGSSESFLRNVTLLAAGLSALWIVASSRWVDRHTNRLIGWALQRYSSVDVRDYENLLQLGDGYRVSELFVAPEDWLAGETLEYLGLREEGVNVLGVRRADGEYEGTPTGATRLHPGDVLLLYGREDALRSLDERRAGHPGNIEHAAAVARQEREHRAAPGAA